MMVSRVLLTTDDIERWEGEIKQIEAEMAALTERRAVLHRKVKVARAFAELVDEKPSAETGLGMAAGPEANPVTPPDEHSTGKAATLEEVAEPRPDEGTDNEIESGGDGNAEKGPGWKAIVRDSVYAHDMGIGSYVLREEVARGPHGTSLARSNKGYYNAISRLTSSGEIVKYKGRLFSPEAYNRYIDAVSNGLIVDNPPTSPERHSPMGEEILKIVYANPGISSSKVIDELRIDPEFAEALHPRPTVVYNIIARLRNRGRLVKRGEGLFPTPERNEPPNGHARGGS